MSTERSAFSVRGKDGRMSEIPAEFDCSYDVEFVSRFTGDDGTLYFVIPILVDGERHLILTKMLAGKS
jgi:hypothetical protein